MTFSIITTAKRISANPYVIFLYMSKLRLLDWVNDKAYLRIIFRGRTGTPLNLTAPKSFNEKLQWLKLNYHNSIQVPLVDKYEAKKIISQLIGSQYLIPTIGVWNRFEDINFDQLPDQFVLKCTHDSGGVVICKNKSDFNVEEANHIINRCLNKNYYYYGREWPYKYVKPRIIAEPYMKNGNQELVDYKVHNFNGIPRVILVCQDRFKDHGMTEDFYTIQWEHIKVKRLRHGNASIPTPKPEQLGLMLELAEKLSKGFPFVRTDFYVINGQVYVGELTFFPASGFELFDPESFDMELGSWIDLTHFIANNK